MNFIRLVLAWLVLLAHSFAIIGTEAVQIDLNPLGGWAVGAFFGISGFLISESMNRTMNMRNFLIKRVLRIFPAFWVVLVITSFVFAPIASYIFDSGTFTFTDQIGYIFRNVFLLISQHTLGNTLSLANYPNSWNGSLWSLAVEFACYISLALGFTLIKKAIRGVLIAGTYLVLMLTPAIMTGLEGPNLRLIEVLAYFLVGMLFWNYKEKIKIHYLTDIISLITLGILVLLQVNIIYSAFFVSYLIFSISVKIKFNWFRKNDLSYGLYLYAFPVQQLVYFASQKLKIGFVEQVLFATIISLFFAAGSWYLVEKPALKYKLKLHISE